MYDELNLKKGVYDAYQVDDNLLIVSDKSEKVNKSVVNWKWKYSGITVGVDTGTFGFFSKTLVEEINEIIPPAIKTKKFKSLPYIDFPKENYFFVNTNMLYNPRSRVPVEKMLPNDLVGVNYGVIGSTNVGDGGFDCYVIGRDKAILIGGITAETIDREL
ncbi:MAG: hypothetical protein Terrestrivirus1_125 [Terrestrivirus sp.]|uniref:Uncharacterized protein n=1 Tax=Terrestrivirus sp. TaxID=2487775 RepID=A0A3G4ZMI0_9VIRU|nr:MAG: hypothetical protein Terrestrivirus1_125 [Terrestrivirus sp.]